MSNIILVGHPTSSLQKEKNSHLFLFLSSHKNYVRCTWFFTIYFVYNHSILSSDNGNSAVKETFSLSSWIFFFLESSSFILQNPLSSPILWNILPLVCDLLVYFFKDGSKLKSSNPIWSVPLRFYPFFFWMVNWIFKVLISRHLTWNLSSFASVKVIFYNLPWPLLGFLITSSSFIKAGTTVNYQNLVIRGKKKRKEREGNCLLHSFFVYGCESSNVINIMKIC